jgi:hypothetical protein
MSKKSAYNPATLSRISSITNVFAWFNLATALFYLVFRLATLDNRMSDLFSPFALYSGHWWEWHNLTSDYLLMNILPPILIDAIGLVGSFFLFKSVAIGLNVLLEIDFNTKSREDGGQNE